ncbi:Epoxide hydrolase 4, variant 2 [Umbelopsis sp. WA50703]
MSGLLQDISRRLYRSVVSLLVAPLYVLVMVPRFWATRKLGVGFFESKDRSHLYKKLFSEDNEYGHHRYIDIGNGKKFHVVENGNTDGPLVFFLHGFPQCWYTWRNQLVGLKDKGYHLVAMDMRGYGSSYRAKNRLDYNMSEFKSDVRGVIEALQKDKPAASRKVTLVAHDWGAIVGWHVLADSWKLEKTGQGYINKGVIINIGHPLIVTANIAKPFKEYITSHWALELVKKPRTTIATLRAAFASVFAQLLKSYYVYIFQLPTPIARTLISIRDWISISSLVKAIKINKNEDVDIFKAAASYTLPEDSTFALDHAVEYYRHGAVMGEWKVGNSEDGIVEYPVLVLWVSALRLQR